MRINLKRKFNNTIALIMSILMLCLVGTVESQGSIIIEEKELEEDISGKEITIKVYKIATKSKKANYKYTNDFAENGYSINEILNGDSSSLSEIAKYLDDYTKASKIKGEEVVSLLEEDIVLDTEPDTLYLIVAKGVEFENTIYHLLPIICEDTGEIKITPKYFVEEKVPNETIGDIIQEPDQNQMGDIPYTGLQMFPLYIKTAIGIVLIITAWGLRRGKKIEGFLKWSFLTVGICLTGSVVITWNNTKILEEKAVEITADIENYIEEFRNEQKDSKDESEFEPEYGGIRYKGTINIPALGVNLPVSAQCTEETLKISPGIFYGSAEGKTMVIGAHNWKTQFGYISLLRPESEVTFTDINGISYKYKMEILTEVDASESEKICNSGYDLVLFTCNGSGARRVIVYCNRV